MTPADLKRFTEQRDCCAYVTKVYEKFQKDEDIPQAERDQMQLKLRQLQELGQPPQELFEAVNGTFFGNDCFGM